jgi:hypothetical protein
MVGVTHFSQRHALWSASTVADDFFNIERYRDQATTIDLDNYTTFITVQAGPLRRSVEVGTRSKIRLSCNRNGQVQCVHCCSGTTCSGC